MTRGPVYLVFGISGVGKSTACKDFVSRHPEYLYLTASALMRDATQKERDQLRQSKPKEILKHQTLLRDALDCHRTGQWSRPVLLDVHSVIDNDSEFVRVPTSAVKSLGPAGMVLLEASPDVVARRREMSVPQKPLRSIDHLRKESEIARDTVTGYAEQLKLPLITAEVGASFRLDDAIADLTKRGIPA